MDQFPENCLVNTDAAVPGTAHEQTLSVDHLRERGTSAPELRSPGRGVRRPGGTRLCGILQWPPAATD